MKKWLFKDSFTLHSELTVEALVIYLSLSIAPAPLISWHWPWEKHQRPYDGEVTSSGFKATRIIDYQNSFLPKIKGQFEPSTQGTIIHITMAPNPWIIGFNAFGGMSWYGTVLSLYLSARVSTLLVIYLLLPLVYGFIAWLAFWTEARRSRKELIKITRGRLQQPLRTDSLGFKLEAKP